MKHYLPGPADAVPIPRLLRSNANAHRDMPIMPTGMHHTRSLRAICDIVGFVDRQRVHVEAQQHSALARLSASHEADDTGFAHTGHHFIAKRAKLLGHNSRRANLLKSKLRVRMQVAPDRDQLIGKFLCFRKKRRSHVLLLQSIYPADTALLTDSAMRDGTL